jgi:pimeloyl-ACP methyl ester carboxylesterase
MVCLHGFTDTWRTWELVLPVLERRHEVLAPTLAGHAGGRALTGPVTAETLADAVEEAMDAAGFATAHLVGNSLGGFVALQLAARRRAESVVALAPAGGWARGDRSYREVLAHFPAMQAQVRAAAPRLDALLATAQGRRRATRLITTNYAHLPAELLAHQALAVLACDGLQPLVDFASREGYELDAAAIDCPVRVIWGTADRQLAWPSAAARYRTDWLPHADWIELDGIGHCPQLDVPLETAHLITGFTTS